MHIFSILVSYALFFAASSAPTAPQDVGWTTIFSDDFSGGDEAFAKNWSAFAGHWYVKDGVLNQDHGGYDLGAVVRDLYLRCDHRIETRVRLVGGGAGSGLYWNVADQRTGESGNMLRFDGNVPIMYGWMKGRYFLGSGGASGSLYADGTWHEMRMDVWNSRGTFDVYWDGRKIVDSAPMYHRAGYVGLQSSMGHSQFDDVRVSVPEGVAWRAKPRGKVMPEWVESVTVLPDGNIAYPVRTLGVVQVVTQDGALMKELGDGVLHSPVTVASDAQGTIYVVDAGDNRVKQFRADGRSAGEWSVPGSSSLYGIAVARDGDIWLSDPPGRALYCLNSSGVVRSRIGEELGLDSPRHLSIVGSRLYVADGSRCHIVDLTSGMADAIDLKVPVRAVTVDRRGNLIVSTGERVQTFGADGKRIATYEGSMAGGVFAEQIVLDSAGRLVVADGWQKRIVILSPKLTETKPVVSRIGTDSATVSWRTDLPTPTKLHLLDTHVAATLPPSADYSSAEIFGDGKLRTEHRVELKGLRPATRYTYAVSAPVRTIPAEGLSISYRFATHAPKGMMAYSQVPVAVIAYAHVTFESQRDPSGTSPPPAIRDDAWFDQVVRTHEGMRMFYWTNSMFRLDPKCMYLKVDRPVDFTHLGSSSEEVFRDVLTLATQESLQPTDFGAVIVIGGNCCYAYPWPTPWWGGKLTHTTGCCFAGGGDMWLSTHEFHHLTEGWMGASGTRGYQSADMPWGLAGRFGENYDFLAYTLRVMPLDSYLNLAFGKLIVTADRDADGVPDDEPRAVWDEKRAGTNPNDPNSYRNGLSDLQNLTASTMHPAVPGHEHPMLTKQIDLKYPFAVFDYAYDRPKKSPTIDGRLTPGEWDAFASTPNAVTPFPRGSIYREAMPSPPGADYRMQTYLNWDDEYLYIAARAPYRFLLSPQLDCNADGYFHGADNLRLHVQIPRDDAGVPPNQARRAEGIMVWNNVEPVQQRGVPDWTNTLYDRADDTKWAWGRDTEGWYCMEIAIPRCDAVGLTLKAGKEMGVRLWVRASLPPTDRDADPGYAFEMFGSCEYGYFRLSK
ncbi:MAG: hypothetical protein AMXMBFR61_08260 [Fimbriimonadales bacterium]